MRRKHRLAKIREVRATRDESLTCDNVGRIQRLTMLMPHVSGYSSGYTDDYYQVRKHVTVTFSSGARYGFSGYGEIFMGYRAAIEFAYQQWLTYNTRARII